MAQEYSRSDFLRALMTQKNSLALQDNVLVNPSVAQAATLDTSFQGVQAEPEPESNDRNWWQRTIDTLTEIGSNVTEGVVGFFDSIGDALIYGAGAIGSAFGASTDWAKEAIAYDWNDYAIDAMQRVGSAPFFDVLSGDIFTNDYWTTNGRDRLAKQHEGSWVNEASDTFKDYYQSIEQGIGNVLPNIVLGIFTGGLGTAASMAIGTAVAATQGFGSGTAEALQDGATYGQAGAYGALSGAIEAGTEAASAGIGKLTGAGSHIMGRKLGEKITKLTVKEVVHSMAEEGAEEFVSEWLSPLAKSVYKGSDALKAYEVGSKEWREQWHNSIVAFAGGAAGGALGSVISTNVQKKMIGDTEAYNITVDISNELTELDEARLNDNKAKIDELQNKLGEDVKALQSRLDTLEKENPEAYKRFLKALADPTLAKSEAFKSMKPEEQLKVARDSINARFTADSVQHVTDMMNDLYSKSGIDVRINWSDDADLNNHWLSVKTKEKIVKLNDKQGKLKGFFDPATGQVYLSRNYEDEFGALIRHEAFSHGILEANEQIFDRLYNYIDKQDNKVFHKVDKDFDVDDDYKGKTENELKRERLASYLENHLSASDLVKLLENNRIERSNLVALLRKIKSKFTKAKNAIDTKIIKQMDKAIKALQEKVSSSDTVLVKRQETALQMSKDKDRLVGNHSIGSLKIKVEKDAKGYLVYVNGQLQKTAKVDSHTVETVGTSVRSEMDEDGNYKAELPHYYNAQGGDEVDLTTKEGVSKYLKFMEATKQKRVSKEQKPDKVFNSKNDAAAYLKEQNITPNDNVSGVYENEDHDTVIIKKSKTEEGKYTLKIRKNKALEIKEFKGKNQKEVVKKLASYLNDLGVTITKDITGTYHPANSVYEYRVRNNIQETPNLYVVEKVFAKEGDNTIEIKDTPVNVEDNKKTNAQLKKMKAVDSVQFFDTEEKAKEFLESKKLDPEKKKQVDTYDDKEYVLKETKEGKYKVTVYAKTIGIAAIKKTAPRFKVSTRFPTYYKENGNNRYVTFKVNKETGVWTGEVHNFKTNAVIMTKEFESQERAFSYFNSYVSATNDRNAFLNKKYRITPKKPVFTAKEGVIYQHNISHDKGEKTYKVTTRNYGTQELLEERAFENYYQISRYFEQAVEATNDVEELKKKVGGWEVKEEQKPVEQPKKEEPKKKTNAEIVKEHDLLNEQDTSKKNKKADSKQKTLETKQKEEVVTPEKAKQEKTETVVKEVIKLVNKPTSEEYKNYAKAYHDTFVTYKSSNEVAELLSAFITADAKEKGVNISTKEVDKISSDLFQNYNTLTEKELPVRLNSLITEWLKTEIDYGEDSKITIAEVLKVDGLSQKETEKFALDMATELAAILKSKSEKTRYAKLKEFMRERINAISERVKYYKATSVELYNTAKRLERAKDRIKNLSLSKYGLNQLQVAYLNDAASVQLAPSKSKLGFAPKKVAEFVDKISWFSKERIEKVFPWFIPSEKALAEYEALVKDINGDDDFLNHQVSLDNLERLSTVVKDINRLSIVAENEEAAAKVKQISKATTEWKAVRTAGFEASKSQLVSFVSKIINDFASPYAMLSGYFGYNSSIVDVLHTQVFESTSNKERVKNQFKKGLNEIYAKNGISEKKLGRKVTFTVHPTNGDVAPIIAQLTINELSHMYIVSQTEQGLATLLNGGYSYDNSPAFKDFHHLSEEDITSLKTIMEQEGMVQCCDDILQYINKEIKQYKSNKDLELFGVENVMDRVYFPMNKQITDTKLDPEEFSNYRLDPSKWSNNRKNRYDTYHPVKGGNLTEILDTYFDALATYGEMYEALTNVETLMRQMLKHNDADYYLPSLTRLLNFYAKQITGQDVDISGIGKGKFFSRIITATLFGSASVVLKQIGSAPTIMNEVRATSYLKALFSLPSAIANYRNNKQLLAMRSGLMGTRWQTHDLIKGQTLSNTVSKVAAIMGIPMEKMDEAVIVTLGFKSAEFDTKAEYPTIKSFSEKQLNEAKAQLKEDGITDYTENDLYNKALEIETIKLTERIVARTQSNAMKTEMSIARSGAGGFIEKMLSFFTSDLQNKYSKAVALFREKAYAKKRITAATALIEKTQEQIKTANSVLETLEDKNEILEKKAEIEDLERTLSEANQMLAEAQEIYNNDTGRAKQFTKYAVSLAASAAIMVGIEQLIKRLLGKKGWDEKEEPEDLAKAFLLEWTLFNIPAFETIYNMIDYDEEFTSLNLSLPNEILSVFKSLWKAASEGKDWRKAIVPMIKTISYATGFPFYNLYNLTMGFVKNFSPDTGIKWDSAVRGYSTTYITGAYKAAAENGGDTTAKNYLKVSMGMYRSGIASDEVINELHTLYTSGYDVLPKNYMQSYVDENGAKVELTKEQIKTFKETYQLANTAVESMLKVTDYRNATPEIKSKLIKSLFDAYYDVAKARTLQNAEGLSKVEKLIYYSSNKFNVTKYLPVLNAIKSIEATGSKTKKDLTIAYINKLSGFSRQEKLLLMYLNGYTIKDASLKQLKSYLTSRGIVKAGISEMFGK